MMNFDTAYNCFDHAQQDAEYRRTYAPIFDVIAKNFVGKPFTVREVGEYMMGEDYHKKTRDFFNLLRISKARDLTAQITALLRAMKKGNKVKSWQAKDYAHPRTVESYEYSFEVNGVTYPDMVEVITADGSTVRVPTSVVYPNAKRVERKVMVTVYPKVTYYQFV